jgi:hypothetical protein
MARRYGGKYSPPGGAATDAGAPGRRHRFRGRRTAPGGARVNLLFAAPLPLLFRAFADGPFGMVQCLVAFAALILGVWLLREGLKAEAAFNAREVARRPALPRKFLAAELTGIGVAVASFAADGGILGPVVYGMVATALQLAAFGFDPMRDKMAAGIAGADPVATRRVAKVVDTGEAYLKSMASVIARLGDRQLDDRVEEFQVTAREMFRTVERDPRDLTAARKYMGVYLMGARDAADRFATVYERSRSPRDRADFIALLDDMQARFEARTETLLADNRADMEIEIEVLRERLIREGVRPEPAKES